jgi:hypothetical protein
MKREYFSQPQDLIQAPVASDRGHWSPVGCGQKAALFSLAWPLLGPAGRQRKQPIAEKVGKFVALRLELG